MNTWILLIYIHATGIVTPVPGFATLEECQARAKEVEEFIPHRQTHTTCLAQTKVK